jgi:hypothetical protein
MSLTNCINFIVTSLPGIKRGAYRLSDIRFEVPLVVGVVLEHLKALTDAAMYSHQSENHDNIILLLLKIV